MQSFLPPLGIFNQMWAAPGRSDSETIRDAIEEITLADELGFTSVWIGEHHTLRRDAAFYGRVPAPEVFLAYIAAKTKRIIVGTGIKVLPSTSAQRAAEEMSLLDTLVEGRAEFGIGLGANIPGAKPRVEKAADFRALLGDILRFLARDTSTGLPEIAPRPDDSLTRRLFVAARDEITVAFAAEHGLNFVVGQAELATQQTKHTRNYRAAGGTGLVRGARVAFVAETHAEAERESEAAARLYFAQMAGRNYHKEAVDSGELPPTADTLAEMRRQVAFIVGTPDDVADQLNEYAEQLGLDRLDVMAQVPALPTAAVRRSLALLQAEVRPRLRVGARVVG
jgi:alkanesulfonate monooxygenase SsuD/methylene tetrahydromethanopterin reductase-like flavin-dependent oxidoreductase (luciferase family)